MTEGKRKFHTLDIEYNGEGPFTVVAANHSTIHATIATYVGMDSILFSVSFELDKNTTKHYRLRHVKPGDIYKFTYDGPCVDAGRTIDEIELYDQLVNAFEIKEGFRVGFDIISDEQKRRLSYPDGGGFNVMIANVPQDHARVAVSAGNDMESWNWQQKDLYAGDSFEIEIVETDWWDEYPNIERKVRQAE